jgi:hypothetical protein
MPEDHLNWSTMHYTIERLLQGDEDLAEQFVKAKVRWTGVLGDLDSVPVDALAKRISAEQTWFEINCGGRYEGQEVMAWSAFAILYSTDAGFDGREKEAKKLLAAFLASPCSLEVHGHARSAAASYGVNT